MSPPRPVTILDTMPRQLRPHLPGVPFHITARAQGRSPVFEGIEAAVCAIMRAAVRRSDAQLLAHAVMPNHLHIVLLQGRRPLHHYMQPMLRRIALWVQRRTRGEGHVFERRYHSSPCLDPEYLRNAIAYVHLNAFRAGLCETPAYEWCSHSSYCTATEQDNSAYGPAVENVIRVFARDDSQTLRQCVADYCCYLDWRLRCDAHDASSETEASRPERPCTFGGDRHWLRIHAAAALRLQPEKPRAKPDLRDLARYTLQETAGSLDLERLRSGDRGKAVVRVRRAFILRARAAGHTGSAIARFLCVSPTTVSAAASSRQK
jgi:REP element-mobilizing transposase RayT